MEEKSVSSDHGAADKITLEQKVIRALPFSFTELLSDETRKAQRSLLGFSFLLMLIAMGALRFSGTIDYKGFTLSLETAMALRAGIAICVYLEVLVGIRCFTEWSSYRLSKTLPDHELDALASEFAKMGAPKPYDETLEANIV